MSTRTRLVSRLQTETLRLQAQVAARPFFNALAANDLPLESYVGLLHALTITYAALEQEVAASNHPLVAAAWTAYQPKLPLLQHDCAYFKQRPVPELPAATLHALLLADEIRRTALDEPAALLGYLYVLAGSALGGAITRPQVAGALKLKNDNGLAYLAAEDAQLASGRDALIAQLDDPQLSADEQGHIVAAADRLFDGLARIVESLYPIPEHEMAALVAALNPDAGNHAIANDAREIEAALRAGDMSWRRQPYYEWRYGERGRRFTWSDSSWIVTLAQHSEAVVNHQIDWLGRVLAARGMPRWLLEQHLQTLHDELVRAIPEKRRDYAVLAHQAARLQDLRLAQIDEPTARSLIAEFESAVGPEWSARLPGIGDLLVAAVADERAGIKQAVTSVERPLTDPQQFPQTWIDAVHRLMERARRQAEEPRTKNQEPRT